MILRITCLTPKDQAAKCINSQKLQILGTESKRIKAQKLIAHNKFYWDMELEDAAKVIKKCARSEILIKRFYKFLIKSYDAAWRKEAKVKKGVRYVKNYILKKMRKAGYPEEGLLKEIRDAPVDEGFFYIIDKEEIIEFLKQELIEVKTL